MAGFISALNALRGLVVNEKNRTLTATFDMADYSTFPVTKVIDVEEYDFVTIFVKTFTSNPSTPSVYVGGQVSNDSALMAFYSQLLGYEVTVKWAKPKGLRLKSITVAMDKADV